MRGWAESISVTAGRNPVALGSPSATDSRFETAEISPVSSWKVPLSVPHIAISSEGDQAERDEPEVESDGEATEEEAPTTPSPDELSKPKDKNEAAPAQESKGRSRKSGKRGAREELWAARGGRKEETRGRKAGAEAGVGKEKDERRGRSKKRPRVSSPESQEDEKMWEDEPREDQDKEHDNLAPPTNSGMADGTAPPPYTALPTIEQCETIVEEVVREATANLREKLWVLVGRVRNQTLPPVQETLPAPTQESLNYWEFFDGPTATAQVGTGGSTAPQDTTVEANMMDAHATDIESFFRDFPLQGGPPAMQNMRPASAVQDQPEPMDGTEDPRLKPGKGKEREKREATDLMDVDKPFAAMLHATLNATTPMPNWTSRQAEPPTTTRTTIARSEEGVAPVMNRADALGGTDWMDEHEVENTRTVVFPRAAAEYGMQMHAAEQASQRTRSGSLAKVGRDGYTYEDDIQRPPTPEKQDEDAPSASQDKKAKEEAEAKYALNLERRLKSARLAKPIADVEASGQPEQKRRDEAPDRTMAMSLWNERKNEIAKLGLTPPPNELFPAIHANFPSDRVRSVPKQTVMERRREKPGTYVLLDVYGAGPIEEMDVRGTSKKLENALKAITGLEKFRLDQPPRTTMGTPKEHAATTWFASGLYPEAVELLAAIHAWPTAEITFFAYKDMVIIPRYLFAITGFTQNEPDEIRLAVWKLFHLNPIYMSTYRLVGMNPDYAGKDIDTATNELLRTIEVQIRPVDNSPERSSDHPPSVWQSWRDGIRFPGKGVPLSKTEAHLKISGRLTRCKACHGADHLTTQCKWAHYSGWEAVDDRITYQPREQHRERTPRPGMSARSNEAGGPSRWKEEEEGWTEVGQQSRGDRGRAPGGLSAPRGYYGRPRRN
ncbi:hypothetical protein OH77DRAFT_1510529 [Trametes cingulata]|nr:hypothetical protein OH77DRAFT_1510529 [Trametes cingulata]